MRDEPKLVPATPPRELAADALCWRCDRAGLAFATTEELESSDEIIGQARAVEAIRHGLEIKSPGYNVFVTGLTGTGKTTTVRRILEEIDRSTEVPSDKCMVHNFLDPDRPLYLELEAGRGRAFKRGMDELVAALARDIPRVFDSETFKQRRQVIVERHEANERQVLAGLDERIEQAGFTLVRVEMGPVSQPHVAYVHEGEAVALDELPRRQPDLTEERLAALRRTQAELRVALDEALGRARRAARAAREELGELRRTHASEAIDLHLWFLREAFQSPGVSAYLDGVKAHVLDDLDRFDTEEGEEAADDAFRVYRVNVLVDHAGSSGVPIVVETSPTYTNLFGSIETVPDGVAGGRADFMTVKSGSLLKADGGYLVFNLNDAVHDPEIWPALKRALKNESLVVQAPDGGWPTGSVALKPEPIPLRVKVVVVGDQNLYHTLHELDEDFEKIFKIKAEFDSMMPFDGDVLLRYARFVSGLCAREGLLAFDRSAVAALLERAVRETGRSDRISTRFSDIADVAREASYCAQRAGASLVGEQHVERAIDARERRVNLIEEKYAEMFLDGSVLLDVDGLRIGAVNGLTILDAGDHSFGHPVRITAQTAMGRAGIINIEREVELSGKAHSKGVFILEGYLRSRYAQDKPLSVSASIAFEQSYSNVDGDSASSTEIYALLSSLSGLPVRQGIAVTGSMSQLGEIQPIGSVNEKIEGFFQLCRARGLTGDQGVVIPHLNLGDLMLRRDVVEAVTAGSFHIYSVRTIDEGIEILTGVQAGERAADGMYPEGTLNRLVDDRLFDLADGLREFGEGPEPDGPGEDGRDRD